MKTSKKKGTDGKLLAFCKNDDHQITAFSEYLLIMIFSI